MSKSTLLHAPDGGSIAGYDYGQTNLTKSPVTLEELRQSEATMGWTDDDAATFQRHGGLFGNQAEQMVDSWAR